ncbi:MAG: methylisocitrate lyase [Legionella sp.]|nr:methylisocitrate lyase [Legionella sp.]
MAKSMGKLFKDAIIQHKPLQILGTINAYTALLAQASGACALYLSGAGVANASYGLPDLGMTNLSEVLEDVRRVTAVCALPLLVDVDTGWGHMFNIQKTVKLMERSGVAAIHIEDQVTAKRCGHRPNKTLVSLSEMGDRIKAAVDARVDPSFVIMARTDAFAVEGMDSAIERALFCIELGADAIFPEALTSLEDYKRFTEAVKSPVLANCTEFGVTPLYTKEDYTQVGVSMILYPLSAFRAMSQAALNTYQTIVQEGSQRSILDKMQTRQELYDILDYKGYEQKLDELREEGNDI